MPEVVLDHCLGLDTRPAWANADTFALEAATNVQVDPGGSLSTRPAVRVVNTLHAQSVGLYARGGSLRCVVPSGHSYQGTAPTGVVYDGIGDGGITDYDNKISSVLGADTFGISAITGPYGYVAIRRADSQSIEHHWIKEPPASFASSTSTKVTLPFQPGTSILRIANKIVAPSPGEGYFRYCSTVNGPSDWTTPGDAGFEAAMQFVNGARDFIALGIHRGLLAVFFADAVQLWVMDEDPANIALQQVLNGPGTDLPGSVANVLGDSVFLSRSGFANLSTTSTITGEARFAALGERIKSLTASIVSTDTAVSLWSQRRSQYLCAVGTTLYCYSVYAQSGQVFDYWTTWTMPASVTAMVENAGTTYLRNGTTLYQFDDTSGTDYTGTAIAWSFQTRPMAFGTVARSKALQRITVSCTGASTWTPVVDGVVLTSAAVTFPAGTVPINTLMIGHGRRIALRASGSGIMRLDGLIVEAGMAGE